MIFRSKDFVERYYAAWTSFLNIRKRFFLQPIDFNKSWGRVIWAQPILLLGVFVGDIISMSFITLMPIIFSYVIGTKSVLYFTLLMIAAVFIQLCDFMAYLCITKIETQGVHSIYHNAHGFFLTVDPIYHIMQRRGKILGKIERSSRSFEYFLDVVQYEFLPIVVGVISAVVSCFFFDTVLGFVALFFALLMGIANIALQYLSTLAFEKKIIEAEDASREVSTENLAQNALMRATYATNELSEKLYNRNYEVMVTEGTAWIAFQSISVCTKLLYFFSVFVLGIIVLFLIKADSMTALQGSSLLMTYVIGTQDVVNIGRSIRYLLRYGMRIADIFFFIRSFGKQTFPVLAGEARLHPDIQGIKAHDVIEISCSNIHLDYNERSKIFKGHNFYCAIPKDQTNKLYGIIGQSGTGKTTFASLIGGLIRPTEGVVTLNGVDIYLIDDYTRRELIAIQGQVASSVSGTIKSSLLFGIPQQRQPYSDEELIAILEKVKLWKFLKTKGGLSESIGEGGMNLSGGQRQRLNFANLYLRVKFFKPLLILIDEPTSSLDEVSEKAITSIIDELAHETVIFVIAHHLKTIEQAVGILDFSLLKEEKEIKVYTKDELLEHSKYYKKLVCGQLEKPAEISETKEL